MVSVLLTSDSAQKALNKQWRGIDKPTNVLSFSALEPFAPVSGLIGDLSLAYETLHQEAAATGIAFADHFVHLVVHGFLHCLGYDHDNEADALVMETLETDILAGLGIDDPYAHTEIDTDATPTKTSAF
jgi:probable rRNA maturation factor